MKSFHVNLAQPLCSVPTQTDKENKKQNETKRYETQNNTKQNKTTQNETKRNTTQHNTKPNQTKHTCTVRKYTCIQFVVN